MKRSQQKMFGIAVLMAFAIGAQAADPPTTTAADNTRVNKRDADHATTTPTDQPNNSADVKFAADVRSAIYKDKTLSTKAHNVKLVAADGVVTLRGPVASADEKAKVEAIVGSVAGVKRVDNELDVAN
ncbi:MAG: BON domain-containing protein [Dokdonella sp.]